MATLHGVSWICEAGVTEDKMIDGKLVENMSVLRIIRVCSLALTIAIGVFFLF